MVTVRAGAWVHRQRFAECSAGPAEYVAEDIRVRVVCERNTGCVV